MAELAASAVPSVPPVVVGVGDDLDSLSAVKWAAAEADRRGSELVAVHVVAEQPRWSLARASSTRNGSVDSATSETRTARRLLTRIVELVATEFPAVSVRTQLVAGDVAPVLGALSERAGLVVIGGKRQALGRAGHLAGVLGGHGRAPLVVVHSDDHVKTGPIVVGIDMSPESRHALDVAFDQASRMDVPLHVVHAVQRPTTDPSSGLLVQVADVVAEERKLTHSLVNGWREQYPTLEVVESTSEASAAQALIDAATNASMIVVGSHGRGTLAALLLGSVSRALVGRAPCPVAVVPST